MTEGRSPKEIAVERLLADPGLVQRRLDRDLAEVAALGRSGVRVAGANRTTLVRALRSQASPCERAPWCRTGYRRTAAVP